MQHLNIQHRFSNNIFYWCVLAAISSLLIYQYGLKAQYDVTQFSSTSNGLKDYGYWVRAAENLTQLKNPYDEDPLFKSGIFSSTIIYFFKFLLISDTNFFLFMQILNIVGLVIFLLIFKYFNSNNTILLFVLLTFSSTREILVNGQVTGILLGLFSAFYSLINYTNNRKTILKKLNYYLLSAVAGIIFMFLMDIKPNLFLFPLFVLALIIPCRLTVLIGIFGWLLHQAYYSFTIGDVLLISWYNNLLSVVVYKENPNLYGSLGIWQLLNQVHFNQYLLQILPIITFLFCGYLSLRLSKTRSISSALFLAFSTNYFYTYFHFYSFLPILAIMVFWIFLSKHIFFAGFLVSSMEFSFNLNYLNSLLSITLLALVLILYKFPQKTDSRFFASGWITYMVLREGLFFFIPTNPYLIKSIIVMIPFVIIAFLVAKESVTTTDERVGY